jgi:signal transduction histidine kinase
MANTLLDHSINLESFVKDRDFFNGLLATMEEHLKVKPFRAAELKKCIRDIHLATQFSLKLTDQLQNYSNHCPVLVEWINPAALLSNMQQILEQAVGEKINVNIETTNMDGLLAGNPIQLERAIFNIVLNAADATKGEGTIHVRCMECTRDHCPEIPRLKNDAAPDKCCLIEFIDEGCGIQKSDLKSIFNSNFSTKNTSPTNGLGLANVKKTINQMGGIIRVRSKVKSGTTFQVFLPMIDSEAM